jgi:hypothetical protein
MQTPESYGHEHFPGYRCEYIPIERRRGQNGTIFQYRHRKT